MSDAASSRVFTFIGGNTGEWLVTSQQSLVGAPIATVTHVQMVAKSIAEVSPEAAWSFRGVASNERYTTACEKAQLMKLQAPIGRPEATSAALILMRKSPTWWALAQDERRAILEEESHHIKIGLRYLPAVARRLLHCRDLGTNEPFDFLGFLDYAPRDQSAFDEMLGLLRATKEWSFMEREIDIRLVKRD